MVTCFTLETLAQVMSQEGARARACREPFAVSHGGANYNFLRAVYPVAKEELACGWGNCLVLVFDFEDGVFSFEQAIRLE